MANPENHPDLHGNVPDQCSVALLLIDVLNGLDFEGSQEFAARAVRMAERIAALRENAKRAGVPVIYVNDNNVGRWRSDASGMVQHWIESDAPGSPIVRRLAPAPDDYVVLKPKHSGFYATPLETLLLYVRARGLVLAGFTTDQCVLFTASDAFLRDYTLFVPADCTATVEERDAEPALRLMRERLHADTRPSAELDWSKLKQP
jgi:nicotinamidase-related amidase